MQVLVLNNDYTPISITDMIRGFKLVFKGKAEIVEHVQENPIVTDQKIYKRPSVIRLLKYIVLPFKKLNPSRDNIFKRDGFMCLYCNSKRDLTIDHILPKSRGGTNTWENMGTCCTKCNCSKGDRTPEEAGMKLRQIPFKPGYSYFMRNFAKVNENWMCYLV
jgi:5-methylcytosine-specific restriction endonuclease McrA